MTSLLKALVALVAIFGAAPGEEADSALWAGEAARALELFEQRYEANPEDAAAAAGTVEALLALGRIDEASVRSAELWQAGPGRPEAKAARGRALFRTGRLTEAQRCLEPLATDPSAPARGLMALARLHAARGRHESAAALAERALRNGERDPFVWFWASEMIPDRTLADELLERYVAAAPKGQEDWLEAARGTLRLREVLNDRRVWIVEQAPRRVEMPLRLVWDDRGAKLGYVVEAHAGAKDKPVRLMLDTGSSGLFLVERMARKRGFEFLSEETAFGGGGDKRHRSRRGTFPTFRLGELRYRDAMAGTTRRELEPYGRYHGLLGIQALAGYRAILDLDEQKLVLLRHDDSSPPSAGEPFWVVSGQMLIEAGVDSGPRGLFLLDTGATWSILSHRFAATLDEVELEGTRDIRGFGGSVEDAAIVRGVEVVFAGQGSGDGALRAFDMSVRSAVSDVEVSGFVGLDVLAGKKLTIDTVTQRVAIETVEQAR